MPCLYTNFIYIVFVLLCFKGMFLGYSLLQVSQFLVSGLAFLIRYAKDKIDLGNVVHPNSGIQGHNAATEFQQKITNNQEGIRKYQNDINNIREDVLSNRNEISNLQSSNSRMAQLLDKIKSDLTTINMKLENK